MVVTVYMGPHLSARSMHRTQEHPNLRHSFFMSPISTARRQECWWRHWRISLLGGAERWEGEWVATCSLYWRHTAPNSRSFAWSFMDANNAYQQAVAIEWHQRRTPSKADGIANICNRLPGQEKSTSWGTEGCSKDDQIWYRMDRSTWGSGKMDEIDDRSKGKGTWWFKCKETGHILSESWNKYDFMLCISHTIVQYRNISHFTLSQFKI